jgi:hypothetical protein
VPLNTRIAGSPDAIRGVADWLRGSLGPDVLAAADRLHAARAAAQSGWQSPAGVAFGERVGADAQRTDELATATGDGARTVDELAAELHRAQAEMSEIRIAAAEAGLTVQGDLVHEPGPPPPDPGPAPFGPAATPAAVEAHAGAAAAATRHGDLVAAWNRSVSASEGVRVGWQEFLGRVSRRALEDVRDKWFLAVGDVGNTAGATAAAANAKILREHATTLRAGATSALARTRLPSAALTPDLLYRDLDDAARLGREADAAAARAAGLDTYDTRTGLKLGGALALAGIGYDMVVADKPVTQAVVSGAGGFAVSVGAGWAAGAVTGAVLGTSFGPVGTVVGGLVGLGAGLFTSGAIDEVFENGAGEIGGVAGAGWDAVEGGGRAVGDLAVDAWDAIF